MRYRLRTLLILLAVLPPLLWFGWTKYEAWRERRGEEQLGRLIDRFNRELDNGDYEGAMVTAEHTTREFPAEPLAEFMLQKAQFIRSVSRGEERG